MARGCTFFYFIVPIHNNSVGVITSARFPENYPNGIESAWLIQFKPGQRIELSFSSFDTEACCDCLRIYDGGSTDSPLIGKYCGASIPPNVVSTSNEMYLVFESDGTNSRQGFEVEYYNGMFQIFFDIK